jgi:hypothetical protein
MVGVAYDEALANRVRHSLSNRQDVEEKRMFGGLTFMLAGQMCCGIMRDELVVRLGSDDFDSAVALEHVRPFDFTGRPSNGMVYVGHDVVDDDAALAEWVQRGVDYVVTHPRPAKSTKKARG